MKRAIAIVIVIACCSAVSRAQEMRYVDLTDPTPRTQLRYPPASPPKCNEAGHCVVGGGGIGGSVACGAGSRDEPRALRVTLTWLDKIEYSEGDTARFEVKVENAGTVAMRIPIFPHLADLQPQDEGTRFQYQELDLSVVVDPPTGSAITTVGLYSASDRPDTSLELKPGEWIRVRASAKFVFPNPALRETVKEGKTEHTASAQFGLRNAEFTPHPGGYSTRLVSVYPRQLVGPAMSVRFQVAGRRDP